jgi:hypothetical protein
MVGRPTSRTPLARRGGILFEIVLSVALFAGAAIFTLGAVRSVIATLDQTRRRQEAVDLARSKLAELEAGLINLADLRGGAAAHDGRSDTIENPAWLFDLKTSRTEFTGLSLIELTVREDAASDERGVSYTLRQLLPLRESDVEAYQQDELMEGIDE